MRFSPCIDALFFQKDIPVYDQISLDEAMRVQPI